MSDSVRYSELTAVIPPKTTTARLAESYRRFVQAIELDTPDIEVVPVSRSPWSGLMRTVRLPGGLVGRLVGPDRGKPLACRTPR